MSAERTATDPVELWTSRAFIEEVRAWVASQLAPRGSRLTGEWEQPHVRVWSSTIRFETTEGRVWFKVNAIGTAYEPALVALLADRRPGLATDVLAHDDARAWSLTRDGGPALSREELLRSVALARSTGCVTRALSWERPLQDAPATVVAWEEFPIRAWFLELLEPWTNVR